MNEKAPRKPPVRDAIGEIPNIEIFDIGAMAEGADRYNSLITQGHASVTAFEPNPAELEKLQAKKRPKRTYHPYFVGKGGPATFHLARYPGCSSLYEADPSVIDVFTSIGATLPEGNFAVLETETVETHRLDDIPDLPPCDYLKVDVQGAELDVLQGGHKCLQNCVVIEAEVEFLPLYKDQPLFGDIQVYLREQGFVLHKFIDVSGRPFRPLRMANPYVPMSQILWADAIFVRDFTRSELWSSDQLLKAAAILYDVYSSPDLAHFLLQMHDSREGSKRADQLSRTIQTLPAIPLQFLNVKQAP